MKLITLVPCNLVPFFSLGGIWESLAGHFGDQVGCLQASQQCGTSFCSLPWLAGRGPGTKGANTSLSLL